VACHRLAGHSRGYRRGTRSFRGEYLKTRGKNLATKRDFEELKRQLEANTELVERVKIELGRQDWSTREWINLRRMKLEELLAKVHECEVHLDAVRVDSIDGKLIVGANPINELRALGQLYFPELKREIREFENKFDKTRLLCMHLTSDLAKVEGKYIGKKTQAYIDERQALFDQFKLDFNPLASLITERDSLTLASRALLEKIMNVRATMD